MPIAFWSNCCKSKLTFDNPKYNRKQFYDSESDDFIYRENAKLLNYSSPVHLMSSIEKNNFSSETLFETVSLRNPFEDKDEELLLKDKSLLFKQ